MTTPYELSDATEGFADAFDAEPLDREAAEASAFQEINERRARVENTELLAALRGL
jgi:hypothetical protein